MIYFPATNIIEQIRIGKFDLFRDLIEDNAIQMVDFSYKAIDAQVAPLIAQALEGLSVRCLNLGFNQIGPLGVIELAEGLKQSSIVELDLSRNGIGLAVVDLITKLKNTSVKAVKLAYNHIGVQGAKAVRPILLASDIKVDLSHNYIWA
ncbi:MAG TPA: hypothetical protein VFP93_03090 [Gammaproteobacteria bacterium]|nr:hypothetical protein [Gammaproteobacteria bacterium]